MSPYPTLQNPGGVAPKPQGPKLLEPFHSDSTPDLHRKLYDLERCQGRIYWRYYEGRERIAKSNLAPDEMLAALQQRLLGASRGEEDLKEEYNSASSSMIAGEFVTRCESILRERGEPVGMRERVYKQAGEAAWWAQRVSGSSDDEDRDVAEPFDGEARDINTTPVYTALSYTWGDDDIPATPIECDGQVLDVKENPAAAMRVLRKEDESIHVWADAVCINQQDVEERRSSQGATHASRYTTKRRHRLRMKLGEDTAGAERRGMLLSCWKS